MLFGFFVSGTTPLEDELDRAWRKWYPSFRTSKLSLDSKRFYNEARITWIQVRRHLDWDCVLISVLLITSSFKSKSTNSLLGLTCTIVWYWQVIPNSWIAFSQQSILLVLFIFQHLTFRITPSSLFHGYECKVSIHIGTQNKSVIKWVES